MTRQKFTIEQKSHAFWEKVLFTTDCWEWIASKDYKGYGQFWNGVTMVKAHRFVLGDVDDSMTVDHLCRNRACVNPKHLEIVTNKTNVLRGEGITAVNNDKTHCKRGHPLSGNNLYIHNMQRKCKECRRETWRKWKKKSV